MRGLFHMSCLWNTEDPRDISVESRAGSTNTHSYPLSPDLNYILTPSRTLSTMPPIHVIYL